MSISRLLRPKVSLTYIGPPLTARRTEFFTACVSSVHHMSQSQT